jgi:hypothetical protein
LVFCSSAASASCYFYDPTSRPYAEAKAGCASRGGYLAAYQSAEEQLQVEAYFLETGWLQWQMDPTQWWTTNTAYWTSLVFSGKNWWWPDGITAGTGTPSNADPYAHFSYNYQVRWWPFCLGFTSRAWLQNSSVCK